MSTDAEKVRKLMVTIDEAFEEACSHNLFEPNKPLTEGYRRYAEEQAKVFDLDEFSEIVLQGTTAYHRADKQQFTDDLFALLVADVSVTADLFLNPKVPIQTVNLASVVGPAGATFAEIVNGQRYTPS